MITITVEAATAAEARFEMQAFLAGNSTAPAAVVQTSDAGQPADTGRRGRGKTKTATEEAPQQLAPITGSADAQQDKADEKADTAASKEAKLTVDDVRAAANPYIEKHGMAHAQVDLMACLKAATGVEKISALPADNQDVLKKAVDAFKAAAAAGTRYGQLA